MSDENSILELFSGIGGMHYALKYSKVLATVRVAVDINPVANSVYKHNFPDVLLLNKNVQSLSPAKVKSFGVNAILMSPPCQPFTRNGRKLDNDDARTDALKHLIGILDDLTTINYILMENVKGFESSKSRESYVKALKEAGFYIREFILSPSQFGIPNTRHRYFCLARKHKDFPFESERIWTTLPDSDIFEAEYKNIEAFLNEDDEFCYSDFQLSEEVLKKRLGVLDVVSKSSNNTICFTKAYTHYLEGTGSIYTSLDDHSFQANIKELNGIDLNTDSYLEKVKELRLRYFSPKEVANFMCFPDSFSFPDFLTKKQMYRVLGNSINVIVVGELVKVLFMQ